MGAPTAASYSIAIELPVSADVTELLRLSDQYMESLYPPESNHMLDIDSLKASNVRFAVARNNGCAVGCAALVLTDENAAELKRMFVKPALRRSQIGTRLLEFIETTAKAEGVTVIRLETGCRQPEALAFYDSLGYVECSAFGTYHDDPMSIFMQKKVVPAHNSEFGAS